MKYQIWLKGIVPNALSIKVFDFLALGFNLGLAINLMAIFFLAKFNNGGVLVTINKSSEQGIETIIFPIFVVMGLVSLVWMGLRFSQKGMAK